MGASKALPGGRAYSREDLIFVAEQAAQKAVAVYLAEQRKMERKAGLGTDKVKRVRAMLSSYRRMKTALDDEAEFSDEEQIELRWKFIRDFMESPDRDAAVMSSVKDMEKKRQENLYAVRRLERAVEMYRQECCNSNSEEAMRRYEEVFLMYMDKEPHTVQEVAAKFHISDKAVYRDIGLACGIIAVYLLGV